MVEIEYKMCKKLKDLENSKEHEKTRRVAKLAFLNKKCDSDTRLI